MAEGEVGVVARVELADEAAADQELVADGLGVAGGVAQRGGEQGGPAHGGRVAARGSDPLPSFSYTPAMGRSRLTVPLVRVDGELREATWDEALARAGAGLGQARDAGPGAFGMFSCSKATNEMNYLAQKFARVVMGSNNIDSCNRT